eukprot:jgi/Chrzof1/9726/Cz04g13170.t1
MSTKLPPPTNARSPTDPTASQISCVCQLSPLVIRTSFVSPASGAVSQQLQSSCSHCQRFPSLNEQQQQSILLSFLAALCSGHSQLQTPACNAVAAVSGQGPLVRAKLVKAGVVQGLQSVLSNSPCSGQNAPTDANANVPDQNNTSQHHNVNDKKQAVSAASPRQSGRRLPPLEVQQAAASALCSLLTPGHGAPAIASICFKLGILPQAVTLLDSSSPHVAASAACAAGRVLQHSCKARNAVASGECPLMQPLLWMARQGPVTGKAISSSKASIEAALALCRALQGNDTTSATQNLLVAYRKAGVLPVLLDWLLLNPPPVQSEAHRGVTATSKAPATSPIASASSDSWGVEAIASCTLAIGLMLVGWKEGVNLAFDEGIVPRLVEQISCHDKLLQYACAIAIAPMAQLSFKAKDACVRNGALPALVLLLTSQQQQPGVAQSSSPLSSGGISTDGLDVQAAMAIAAITKGTPQNAATCVTAGVMPRVIRMLRSGGEASKRAAAHVLSCLELQSQLPRQAAVEAGAVPLLTQLLISAPCTSQVEAALALASLSAGSSEGKQILVDNAAIVPAMHMLNCSNTGCQQAALQLLYHLASTGSHQRSIIYQHKPMDHLLQLAVKPDIGAEGRLAAVHLATLLTDWSTVAARDALDHGAVAAVVQLLSNIDDTSKGGSATNKGLSSSASVQNLTQAGRGLFKVSSTPIISSPLPKMTISVREQQATLQLVISLCRCYLTDQDKQKVVDSGLVPAVVHVLAACAHAEHSHATTATQHGSSQATAGAPGVQTGSSTAGTASYIMLRRTALQALTAMTSSSATQHRQQGQQLTVMAAHPSPYAQPPSVAGSSIGGSTSLPGSRASSPPLPAAVVVARKPIVEELLRTPGALQLLVDALGSSDPIACQAAALLVTNIASLSCEHRQMLAEHGGIDALLKTMSLGQDLEAANTKQTVQTNGAASSSVGPSIVMQKLPTQHNVNADKAAAAAAVALGGLAMDCASVQRQLVECGGHSALQHLVTSGSAPEVKQAARLALKTVAKGEGGLAALIEDMSSLTFGKR